MRLDKRNNSQMRSLTFQCGFTQNPLGSVMVSMGNTMVLCTASVEESVPGFLKNSSPAKGWVTAEYSLLPGSTHSRFQRERGHRQVSGRTHEIQRLIGRSLRAVIDQRKLGARTITVDCDVVQADGGTRTAAINGAFVALSLAVDKLIKAGKLVDNPILDNVAAISCGIVEGDLLVDLCYEEDSNADVDMNIVMTGGGKFLEVQGTAEKTPFQKQRLLDMLSVSGEAIEGIMQQQNDLLNTYLKG